MLIYILNSKKKPSFKSTGSILIWNKEDIVCFFCTVILFITSWAPFIQDSPLGTDLQRMILRYSMWVIAGAVLLIGFGKWKINGFDMIVILAILIFRGFNILHAYKYSGLGLTDVMIGVLFCIQPEKTKANVFVWFKYLMVFASVFGVICYIAYYMNIGIPYTVIERGKGTGIFFIDYKLIYLMNQLNKMIRFNGFFIEPGWFGTWAAFYLCADQLDFRKKENIILLIGGLLTLSLAFVIMLVIYYVLMNLRDWKKWIWLVATVAVYLFILPNIKTGNKSIDALLERMIITDKGLAGDNRYGKLFEIVWNRTIKTGKVFTGYGAGYASAFGTSESEGLASIKSYIVDFGLIGTFVIFAPLFAASIYRSVQLKNKEILLYTMITYISLYQRPYLFWTPYLIVFICGISYLSNKKEMTIRIGAMV